MNYAKSCIIKPLKKKTPLLFPQYEDKFVALVFSIPLSKATG